MTNALTPWAENKIYKRAYKAASWTVHEIGQGCYEVRDFRRNETCNYLGGTCTCLKWQKSGLPCGHAIAVATSLGSADSSNLACPFYSASNFRATYAPLIYPLGTEETWVVPEQPLTIVRPPLMKKATAGRPSNHDRIPSRGEDPIRKKCTYCGQNGHSKRTCTNRARENVGSQGASGSRQTQPLSTPDNYGGHGHFTFDLNDDLNEY